MFRGAVISNRRCTHEHRRRLPRESLVEPAGVVDAGRPQQTATLLAPGPVTYARTRKIDDHVRLTRSRRDGIRNKVDPGKHVGGSTRIAREHGDVSTCGREARHQVTADEAGAAGDEDACVAQFHAHSMTTNGAKAYPIIAAASATLCIGGLNR